ncbi:MAG: hypothetical protein COA88_13980 [Kordia sp.]|nr:MAG: hypothetical protein COA88_13980 [Kordia sp.]
MPFTFSHPAIILPLKNIFGKWVSLTGLVIGSLTPDFEYFLRMKIQSDYSHTIIGTLWFNLPIGILLCFIFQNIIKNPLIENSPNFIQYRMTELKNLNWIKYFKGNWIVVCLSILIGAYSHLFWDSFTHSNAFFTNFFGLDRKVFNTEISIFKLLQHLSTLIGGIVILWSFLKLKKVKIEYTEPNIKYWINIGVFTISIIAIRIAFGLKITEYGNVIVNVITAGMIAITLASLYEKIKTNGNNLYKT